MEYRALLASIRNLGRCPCPRCLVSKSDINKLGQFLDMSHCLSNARRDDMEYRRKVNSAREIIYSKGYTVDSTAVEAILAESSLVPTQVGLYTRIKSMF
jgi:hypothetical protein